MNKKLLANIILVMFFSFVSEGHAFSGKEYAETCQELRTNTNSKSPQSIICLSFMMGVIGASYDSYQTLSQLITIHENALRKGKVRQNEIEFARGRINALKGMKKLNCISKRLTPQQAVMITLEYLRKNPKELKYQVAGSILTSLGKEFPCPR